MKREKSVAALVCLGLTSIPCFASESSESIVKNAMNALSGRYILVSATGDQVCQKSIEVRADVADDSLRFGIQYGDENPFTHCEDPKHDTISVLRSSKSKIKYGTKNDGTLAFVDYTCKGATTSGGDGYVGALLSGYTVRYLVTAPIDEKGNLTLQMDRKYWSLLGESCTSPLSFYKKNIYSTACQYSKIGN